MNLIQQLLGNDRQPEWASFFTLEDYRMFLELVRRYFQERKIRVKLDAEAGRLAIQKRDAPSWLKDYATVEHNLVNLPRPCRRRCMKRRLLLRPQPGLQPTRWAACYRP